MTADDLTRLRAVAEAATPGPWVLIGEYVSHDTGQCNCGTQGGAWGHEPACSLEPLFQVGNNPDSRFVATFDPPTVAALIDRVERAERQVAAVRQLAAEFESDGLQRWGGNIAWHIEEVLTEGADDGQ